MSERWEPAPLSGEPDESARRLLGGWLSRRGLHGDFAETHVSVLAFTGDRVYKLKKPVRFPFLDLSTAERRAEVCRSEVELNRRIAPDVYLGVCDITDADGSVVDHAIEMVRMPASRRLSTLLDEGSGDTCVDALATLVADFHARCARGPEVDEAASWEGARHLWDMALEQTEPFVGTVLDEPTAREVGALATRFLEGRRPLFDARVTAGRARDGHGDLLADDVFCLDDGPRVLDCLEFDPSLRYGDVLLDVAFLAMDLERRGHRGAARRFLDRYREAARDDWPRSLEHHWIAYRAHVRAKIACFRVEHGDPEAAEHAAVDLELAQSHLRAGRVRLVIVGGAPGTGKSTLAAGLADAFGSTLLRSDAVRDELLGQPSSPLSIELDAGRHSPERRDAVYEEMIGRAATLIGLGVSMVLDASWSETRHRLAAARTAEQGHADFVELLCDAPAAEAWDRIRARQARGDDVSEVTEENAAVIRARFEPWDSATRIDTSGREETSLAAALQAYERR